MKLLTWILCGLALWALILGLWDHSWQLISAGILVAVIWPLIGTDVEAMSADRETD